MVLPKLLITRPLPEVVVSEVDPGFDVSVREETLPLSADEMANALDEYDAILPTLGDPLSAEVITSAKSLRCKLLANFGVGYNHIDVAAAKAAGMVVSNTPGAVTDATADIALTLMLMTCRRAIAFPIRPIPTIPTVFPDICSPRYWVGCHPGH